MKKIITLLLSAGIFTATYAQGNYGHKGNYGRNDQYATSNGRYGDNGKDRDNDDHHGRYEKGKHGRNDRYSNRGYDQRNNSYAYQRQIQMDRINRAYNYKVMSIAHNRYMSNRQKRLAIRDAKKERNYQIQMINRNRNGYAYGNNGYDNYGYGNNRNRRDHDD